MAKDDCSLPGSPCSLYSTVDLARYASGDFPARRRQELRAHLRTCADCRKRLRELEALPAILRRAAAPSPPKSFVLSTQDVRARRRVLWYPVLRLVTTAGALLVVALLLGGLLRPASQATWVFLPVDEASPTPLPVAVGPASTWRARPTQAAHGQPMDVEATRGIPTLPAYPRPGEIGAERGVTLARPADPTPRPAVQAAPTTMVWTAIHLAGLALLALLAGLTWLVYRRERAFFP